MSGQTSVRNQVQAFAGMRDGLENQSRTLQNDKGKDAQVHRFTVDTASASTAYQFEIDGKPVKYTSLGTTSISAIRDGLIAAGRAIEDLEKKVAFNVESANSLIVTAVEPGVGFTPTETDANLSNAAVQANVTTEPIPFGRAVVRGTAGERSGTLPSATGQRFEGVSERIHSGVDPVNADAGEYVPFSNMTIGYRGTWWVEVEEAVSLADNVFFRHTAGAGGTILGQFRTDADTASADQVSNARWMSETDGPGIALLALNLP